MKWFKHIQGCLTENLISIIIPLPVTLHIRCQCLAKVLEQASCKLISAQGPEREEGGVSGFPDLPLCSRRASPAWHALCAFLCLPLSRFKAQLQEGCSEAPAGVTWDPPLTDVNLQPVCRHQSPVLSRASESERRPRSGQLHMPCWVQGAWRRAGSPDILPAPALLNWVTWGSHFPS